MRTLAIVPVKSFDSAKQRLAGALPAGSRRSLAQAMLADVFASLRRCRLIDGLAVVTSEPAAESLAPPHATLIRDERGAGQSPAAEIGIRHAFAAEFERVLLVPGDTPLIDAAELDELLERTANDGIAAAIVPDRHGTGTNALVLAPPDAIVPGFGPNSLARHVERAEEAGVKFRVEEAPSLAHDVDTPDDLAALRTELDAARGGAQCTRGALVQLERSGAIGEITPVRAGDAAAQE